MTIRLIGSFPCFSLWILKGREKNETGVAPRDIETHKDIEGYSLFFYSYLSLSLSKINIFWIKLEFRYRLRENFNIFPTKSFRYLRFQLQNNKTKKLIFRIFNNYDIIKPIDQTLFLFNFFFYPQNGTSRTSKEWNVDGK